MMRSAVQVRSAWPEALLTPALLLPALLLPARAVRVTGSVNRTGPRSSARLMPCCRRYPGTSRFSRACRATRSLLAIIAGRSGTGGGPARPNSAHDDQSRASRAARARVRTGAGPRLSVESPTWPASSNVTCAPSSRAWRAAVIPVGPPPTTRTRRSLSTAGCRHRIEPGPGHGLGRGPLVFADQVHDGVDQGQVGERLREVPQMPAGVRVDFLGIQQQRAGV